jgi:DNA-binding NarL/FixJ family response regulator
VATPLKVEQPVRIVIADEQPIFRDGLRLLIETEPGLRIVGEIGNGSDAVALVRDLDPDVLLLGLTGELPLKTLQEVAATVTSVRTIVLTATVDTPDVARALQLGARGVVPKDSAAEVLFKSIRSVAAGHYWIGGESVSKVASSLRELETARRRSKAFGLTRRELEIVRAVVAGYTNKEIAKRFTISENTVKRHLTHIFNKLGASNRVELALFSAHHRLLDGI